MVEIFLKMKEASLSLQGKQMTLITNFGKPAFDTVMLESFVKHKDFSDETGGETDTCDI